MSDEDVPAELAAVQAFVNTVDVDAGIEELTDAPALKRWLVGRGLLRRGARVSADDLARALTLRAALRDLLLAHSEPQAAAGAAAATRVLAAVPLRLAFAGDGSARLEPAGGGPTAALGEIVAGIPTAVANGTWERLKRCPADDCQWVFYDRSRNSSRRWCSMGVCGNRDKLRAYRRRQRER